MSTPDLGRKPPSVWPTDRLRPFGLAAHPGLTVGHALAGAAVRTTMPGIVLAFDTSNWNLGGPGGWFSITEQAGATIESISNRLGVWYEAALSVVDVPCHPIRGGDEVGARP